MVDEAILGRLVLGLEGPVGKGRAGGGAGVTGGGVMHKEGV